MVNKIINIIIGIAALLAMAFYFNSGQNEESISKSLDLTTVKVLKGNLEKKEEYNGTIRQVDKSSIKSSLMGVITYLPKEGSVIQFPMTRKLDLNEAVLSHSDIIGKSRLLLLIHPLHRTILCGLLLQQLVHQSLCPQGECIWLL